MKSVRNSSFLKVFSINGIKSLHFLNINKLAGRRCTLNFPFEHNLPLFDQVEKIMIANNICQNVTRIDPIDINDEVEMYSIIYNRRQPKHTTK